MSDREQARPFLSRGCAIAILIGLTTPLALCSGYRYWAARQALPPELRIERVLSYHDELGLREGCFFGVYEVTAASVAALGADGRSWLPTPLTPARGAAPQAASAPEDIIGHDGKPTHLYALTAASCSPAAYVPDVHRALSETGSLVRTINHGEGMIVVRPATRHAWYLYFG